MNPFINPFMTNTHPFLDSDWYSAMWILRLRWMSYTADSTFTISSDCQYHYENMSYKSAAQSTKSAPCTNVPIHCPLCPPATSGVPKTIWKYNTVYHLLTDHELDNGTLSPIPGRLLMDMFITRAEETEMGIQERETQQYREDHHIPDSDDMQQVLPDHIYKRERAATMSSVNSESHDGKRVRLGTIADVEM